MCGEGCAMPNTKERDRFGLLTRESFLSCVQNQLHSKINNTTCIAAVDIEHMKLLNNWFGQQTGDRVLRRIASILLNTEEENGYLVGRFGSDDFFLFSRRRKRVFSRSTKMSAPPSRKNARGRISVR